jgi:hypothetical protein
MRLDQAKELKIGDSIYNCFLDKLIITGIHQDDVKELIFSTIDTKFTSSAYYYDDLYLLDLSILSQSEAAFLDWTKNNKDLIKNNIEYYQLLKKIFREGFDKGYEFRLIINAEEQLQK